MQYEKVEKQFGSFAPMMRELIESEMFDNIFRQLKACSSSGRIVCPVAADVFKSFRLVDRHKVKCLFILQDPYPTFRNNKMIADGIPLSCSYTAPYEQPSLHMFHQQLEKEYGFHPDNDLRCDLSYLLEEEHVLMLNSGLTCEKDKSGSHQEIWLPFMQWFIEHVVNKYYSGLPVVMCGTSAQKLEKYMTPMLHQILRIEHPVAAAYQNRSWKADGVFEWVNQIIVANNGEGERIQWLRRKSEPVQEKRTQVHRDDMPSAEELGMPWTDN